MNDAGRIGFVIKGAYSNTATYDFLDVVYYNNTSYVAKKLTIGNAPTENNEYWQILAKIPDNITSNIFRSLTQAEYDALSSDDKTNGTIYFITDGHEHEWAFDSYKVLEDGLVEVTYKCTYEGCPATLVEVG